MVSASLGGRDLPFNVVSAPPHVSNARLIPFSITSSVSCRKFCGREGIWGEIPLPSSPFGPQAVDATRKLLAGERMNARADPSNKIQGLSAETPAKFGGAKVPVNV